MSKLLTTFISGVLLFSTYTINTYASSTYVGRDGYGRPCSIVMSDSLHIVLNADGAEDVISLSFHQPKWENQSKLSSDQGSSLLNIHGQEETGNFASRPAKQSIKVHLDQNKKPTHYRYVRMSFVNTVDRVERFHRKCTLRAVYTP